MGRCRWLAPPASPGFARRLAEAEQRWEAGADARALARAKLNASNMSNKHLDSTSVMEAFGPSAEEREEPQTPPK